MTVDPRHTVAWQRIRRRVVAAARAANLLCPECHYPIDYTASGRTPYGPSVDHTLALATHGAAIALEESRLRVLHTSCNAKLGGRLGRARQLARRNGGATRPAAGMVSREW